jgi:antitoxin (DNA-binding transcriptional repressor) of toxin-antitoxin stability system
MHEAKTHLSRLVDDVRSGREAEVVIALSGRPAVRLVPFVSALKRQLGPDAGLFRVPADFDEPLPPELLAGFEGG